MHNITIYTDGACSGNSGAGGWVTILMCGAHIKHISGSERDTTTSNRMELLAVIHQVTFVKVRGHADNKYNEECDKLAKAAIENFILEVLYGSKM